MKMKIRTGRLAVGMIVIKLLQIGQSLHDVTVSLTDFGLILTS